MRAGAATAAPCCAKSTLTRELPSPYEPVAVALRRHGVVRWSALLKEIIEENVVDADHLMSILAHYESRPGAWGPVALVARIRAAHPDTPAHELWWTPMGDWAKAESIRIQVHRRAARAPTSPERWLVDNPVARRLEEAGMFECILAVEREARVRYREMEQTTCAS